MRKMCAVVVAVVVGALSLLGAGSAVAEPQLPRIATYTENVGTVGDHDYCRGAFNVGMVAPKGTRGVVRVTLKSFGFTGNGIGWKRNPKCRFLVGLNVSGTRTIGQEIFFPVAFGPRAGEKVVRDVRPGSGPGAVGVGTYAINNPVRVQLSYGTAYYMMVP